MSRLLSPSPVTRRRLYFLTFIGSLLTLLYLLWWTSSLSSPLSSLPSLQLYPQTASSSGQAIDDLVQPQGFPEMTQEVQDLRTFLRDAKKQALDHLNGSQRGDRPLVMIMGNGAGDMDSLTSALSLSYLLTYYPHHSLPLSSSLPSNALYVPLIQTNRSDAHLRPENVASIKAAGLSEEEHILYLSDLTEGLSLKLASSPQLSPEWNTYLGLVDHPQLELPWLSDEGSSQRSVVLLVDHHADAGKHKEAALRVFREPEGAPDGRANPTGSAQSVIVELFKKEIGQKQTFDHHLADLAMATILIDTDNLRKPPRGRASPTDIAAMDILLPLSSLASPEQAAQYRSSLLEHAPEEVTASVDSYDVSSLTNSSQLDQKTKAVSDVLAALKAAISHLSTLDLLKRDYKTSVLSPSSDKDVSSAQLEAVGLTELKAGFSSVNLGLPAWLHRSPETGRDNEQMSGKAWQEWWLDLERWMKDQQLTVAVVGTSFTDEEKLKHKRELILAFAPPPNLPRPHKLFTSLTSELEASSSPLELTLPWKGARLTSTGKKERVSGLDESNRVTAATTTPGIWAQVWIQGNTRANRKVYLPTIMAALKKVVTKGM